MISTNRIRNKIVIILFFCIAIFSQSGCYSTHAIYKSKIESNGYIEYQNPGYSYKPTTFGYLCFTGSCLGAGIYGYLHPFFNEKNEDGSFSKSSGISASSAVMGVVLTTILIKALLYGDAILQTGGEYDWLKAIDRNLAFQKAEYGRVRIHAIHLGQETLIREVNSIIATYPNNNRFDTKNSEYSNSTTSRYSNSDATSLKNMEILKGTWIIKSDTKIRGESFNDAMYFNDEEITVKLLKKFERLTLLVGVDDQAKLRGRKGITIMDNSGNLLYSNIAEPLNNPLNIDVDISNCDWITISAKDFNGQPRDFIRWMNIKFYKKSNISNEAEVETVSTIFENGKIFSLQEMDILSGNWQSKPDTKIRDISYKNSLYLIDENITIKLLKKYSRLKMLVGVDDQAKLSGNKLIKITDNLGNVIYENEAKPLIDPIEVDVDISHADWISLSNRNYNGQPATFIRWIDAQFISTSSFSEADKLPTNKPRTLIVDIETNIPLTSHKQPNTYALIIGNEDYTKYQPVLNSEQNVKYAKKDAELFKKYCVNTLGIPEENITLVKDAISTQMRREILKLVNKAKYKKGVKLIFYYSGHGFPDNKNNDSYLIPVDVNDANITDGYKISKLMDELVFYSPVEATVFLDACFSGAGRHSSLVSSRGIKVVPKSNTLYGNIVVFSADSSNQEALPFDEKQHGLFTYYLLKKIQETKGNISYGELQEYLKQEVSIKANDLYYKTQNPTVNVGQELLDSWQELKLIE